jgi:ribosomal protein L22
MSDEQKNDLEAEAVESADAVTADAVAESADTTAPASDASAPVEAKPKPARKPRAAKPKVADEAPAAEKPKRTRAAAKPKVAEAAAEAPVSETTTDKPKAAPKRGAAKQPEPEAKPARRGREQPVAAPVVRAQAKYVRSSARKARLVCDNIRGKSVDDARAILAHTPRAVARDWSKLLESAVANAEHNHELVGEDLFIKAVTADEGPTIKRFRPRAMGRATQIRKRTSHLTILLTPKN